MRDHTNELSDSDFDYHIKHRVGVFLKNEVYNESHVFTNKGKWFDETRLHPEVPEEGGATAPSVQPLPKNLRATSEEIQRNRAKT
jgi:hypothetical protein